MTKYINSWDFKEILKDPVRAGLVVDYGSITLYGGEAIILHDALPRGQGFFAANSPEVIAILKRAEARRAASEANRNKVWNGTGYE